jgi:hypothetical protein
MFNQQELQILLGGVNAPVDVQDLRAHTQYGGLYGDDEPTVQMFWKVSILEDWDLIIRSLTFICRFWRISTKNSGECS